MWNSGQDLTIKMWNLGSDISLPFDDSDTGDGSRSGRKRSPEVGVGM